VAARGDPSPILDAAEEVFDFVSSPVEALGAMGLLGGVAAVRDAGKAPRFVFFDLLEAFLSCH
jgi:hypothetical protein